MHHRQARATLAVVFAATVLIGLNATMLSVALPTAIHDLGASPLEGTWMLLAYLVVAGSGRAGGGCCPVAQHRCGHHRREPLGRAAALMPSGPRRPGFYLGILLAGFLVGGFMTALLRQYLPESVARDFFTTAVTANLGPVSVDLLVLSFTLGPIGLNVSLMSLVGVLVAYLIARSLF